MFEITNFCDSKQEAVDSPRMRDLMSKNGVNCISIPNCHPGNKLKIGSFWFVFLFQVFSFFHLFYKKNGGGGKTEKSRIFMDIQNSRVQ